MPQDPRQLDTNDLQAQTRSLRALARSLVGDEHQAEDLVQETWVTALDRGPKKQGRFGAWLAGVTKNHARQQRREQGRRDNRERKAARPEAIPADDSIERLDTLRHILDHVRGMDEPYRSTLLLRYFDELSPQEIAEKQGIPYATVRTHLHRALEKLRQRMDETTGGSREAWVSSLLPFISAGAAVATAAAGSASAASLAAYGAPAAKLGVGLGTKIGIGVAAIAVAAGAWIVWPLLQGSGEDNVVIVDTEQAESAHREDKPFSKEIDRSLASQTPDDGKADGQRLEVEILKKESKTLAPKGTRLRIRGRVVSADSGQGIAKATIQVGKAPTIETDERGNYDQEIVVPAIVDKSALAKDGKLAAKGYDKSKGAAKRRESGKTSKMSPTGISAPSKDGSRSLWVQASAPGFVPRWLQGKIPADGSAVLVDFALDKGFVLAGRVVDVDGQGIVGAWLNTNTKGMPKVQTDKEGRFRVDYLDPKKRSWFVMATAKGFTANWIKVSSDEQDPLNVRIVLEAGARIHGIVRGPDLQPVEGARLELWSKDRQSAVSDAKGAYELPAVGTGRQRLVVRHKQHAILIRTIEVPGPGEALQVDLQLEMGMKLSGRAHDASGRGVPSAKIQVRSSAIGIRLYDALTDETGRFQLEGLPAGEVGLYITAEGFLPRWTTGIAPRGQKVEILMHRGAGLAGRVFDAGTGKPIERFVVRLRGPTAWVTADKAAGELPSASKGKSAQEQQSLVKDLGKWIGRVLKIQDAEGHWSTGDDVLIAEGTQVALTIQAKGYAEKRIPAAMTKRNPHHEDLPIGLERGTHLRGRLLVQATSMAVPAARIHLLLPGDSLGDKGWGKQAPPSDRSNAEGKFAFENVAPGSHRLVVEHADWGTSLHDIEVPAGIPEHEITLRLQEQGILNGQAFGLDGRPLANDSLQLMAQLVPGLRARLWNTMTDATGRFTFRNLPRGIYRLSAIDKGGRKAIQRFGRYLSIAGEGNQDCELRPTGSSSIRGTLRANVELPRTLLIGLTPKYPKDTPWEQREAPRQVQAQVGTFRFPSLPTGTYRLSAVFWAPEHGGMFEANKDVDLTTTGELRLELELLRSSSGK